MIGHISQWGNSLGIRIPGKIAQALGVKAGSDVEILLEKGRVILTPRPRMTVASLLEGYPKGGEEEISTGDEMGEEAGEW